VADPVEVEIPGASLSDALRMTIMTLFATCMGAGELLEG
jgi:hypothetical protein